jgi:toxin ParE1/3/4
MKRVTSSAARADMSHIWNYIADDDPVAADRVIRHFDKTIALLLTQPKMGRTRNDLGLGLRSFPTKYPYTLFYRLSDGTLTVVRVLHQARDFESIFS